MDRRKALVQMGLSMGYVVAAPTFAGLLQSCKDEKTVEWLPHLLTEAEGSLLHKLVDVILPKTDTPSASELNVHKFIDYFAAECFEQEQQDVFKTTLAELAKKARSTSGKTDMSALTVTDLTPVMKTAVTQTGEKAFSFAKKLRDLTIWGYKCNEYVGEEVLAYLPVPGGHIPCGDLDELTGGKAWSI